MAWLRPTRRIPRTRQINTMTRTVTVTRTRRADHVPSGPLRWWSGGGPGPTGRLRAAFRDHLSQAVSLCPLSPRQSRRAAWAAPAPGRHRRDGSTPGTEKKNGVAVTGPGRHRLQVPAECPGRTLSISSPWPPLDSPSAPPVGGLSRKTPKNKREAARGLGPGRCGAFRRPWSTGRGA